MTRLGSVQVKALAMTALLFGVGLASTFHGKESVQASALPSFSTDGSNATTYYAVIAACSQYNATEFNLPKRPFRPFSDETLSVLYQTLLETQNWDASNIVLLLNENATGQAIRHALQSMAQRVGPNDIFLFSWCGHGTAVPDLDGDEAAGDPRDTTDEALCPHDVCYLNGTISNIITDDELGQLLSAIDCRGMCLAFDCCLSGGLVNVGTMENGSLPVLDVNGENRVVLMATPADRLELVNPLTGFPLTVALAKALGADGTDADADGNISAEEAFAAARPKVALQSSLIWLPLAMRVLLDQMRQTSKLVPLIVKTMTAIAVQYLLVQLVIRFQTGYFFQNRPTISDDVAGDLPLVRLQTQA